MAPSSLTLYTMTCNATDGQCSSDDTTALSSSLWEAGVGGDHRPRGLLSDEMMFYFQLTNWSFICGAISLFGVVSNAINMAVLIKSGFKDSINCSLFALAVSDFGSCFSLIFCIVAMNPWFQALDLPFSAVEVQYMLAAWPHVAFTKITTLITAFITIERCLCVSLPLKFKSIVTRTRVIGYLVFSYALIIALMIPIFYANRFAWVFYAQFNKTMLGLVFTEDRKAIETAILPILNAFLSIFAFFLIILSTVILVVKLNEKAKWRLRATATNKTDVNNDNAETKEQKISKMVVIISTVFIVCFLPTVAMQLAMWADRRISIDGEYRDLNSVMASFTFILESLNSAMNIVIYYNNSSNYKAVFDQMFRPKLKTQGKMSAT